MRPYARMSGSYEDPVSIPIPKFVTLRLLAQTVAQRAQCQLLLGQTDAAMRELSMLHNLSLILEAKPSGKPMTLVAAMIHSALSRLYVGVVADGLRLNAWGEPQLAAIQAELRTVNLLPLVSSAFETERASLCHLLETLSPDQPSQMVYGQNSTGLGNRMKDPVFIFLALAPRGWVYHNMVTVAGREQMSLDSFDRSQNLILPGNAELLNREFTMTRNHFSPKSFLADDFLPNFIRAIQETARTQTLVNEALVACALERYHLVQGRYPELLEALLPAPLEVIPVDVIGGRHLKYHATERDRFLLYSIGWNQKDDGGAPGSIDVNKFDVDKGDWVWPYREKLIK